jgi:hypothetical protein
MADAKLSALTEIGAIAADDELYIVDTSGTASRKVPFARIGLEIDTTYDTAADHADIPAATGKLYIVNMGTLASDMNFTLPVAANVETGDRVGVYVSLGDDTYEMDLKSGAAGDLINNIDHFSTSWSRLFITGEYVEFLCVDGSTGDWIVVHDGRIPSACKLDGAGDTDQSINSATWTAVTILSNSVYDVGSLGDTTNDKIIPRRDGRYLVTITAFMNDAITGEFRAQAKYDPGGVSGNVVLSPKSIHYTTNGQQSTTATNAFDWVVGTHIDLNLHVRHTAGSAKNLAAFDSTSLEVVELL